MKASNARKRTDSANANGMNSQRRYVLRAIAEASAVGRGFVVLDDSRWKLFDDDYAYLENLGYIVHRPTAVKFGIIAW